MITAIICAQAGVAENNRNHVHHVSSSVVTRHILCWFVGLVLVGSCRVVFGERITAVIPHLVAELAADATMAKYWEIVDDMEKTRIALRRGRDLPPRFTAPTTKILLSTSEAITRILAGNDSTAQGPARSMAIQTIMEKMSHDGRRCDGHIQNDDVRGCDMPLRRQGKEMPSS